MCSLIHVCSVDLQNNPAKLDVPYKLDITFEALEYIKDEVGWELIFVASDGDEKSDQVLDDVVITDVKEGRHKFTLECNGPKVEMMKPDDLTDVTLLLLKCKFRDEMFLKVGWFVTHVYEDAELLENPPEQPIPEKMLRKISEEDCRVTHYSIKWNYADEVEEDSENTASGTSESPDEMDTTPAPLSQTSVVAGEVESMKLAEGGGDATTPKSDDEITLKSAEISKTTASASLKSAPFADVTNN